MEAIRPSLKFENLIFLNFVLPTQLLEPIIPQPLLLDAFSQHGERYSYVSVVLICFTGIRILNTHVRVPRILQMNYRTYGRYFGKRVIYFIHSFVEWFPTRLLKGIGLPVGKLDVSLYRDHNHPGETNGRIEVYGSAGKSPLELQISWDPRRSLQADQPLVDELTERNMGIFQKKEGNLLYLKISHPPFAIQPANVSSAKVPRIRELPFFPWDLRHLSSAWFVRQTVFEFHLGFSLGLKAIDSVVRRRLRTD